MKRRTLRLKAIQQEAIALFEYLIAESFASGADKHYRLKVPYGPTKPNDGMEKQVEMIIDISVYFDGELSDERDETESRTFKITGPDKGRQ